ncbi:MAG: hypothetical protein ACKVOQ_08550 [Cyclobacteriaceae bacterium]
MTHYVKRTTLTCATVLLALAAFSQSASSIVGQWKDEKEPDRQMEFYQDKDGLYYAKTINSKKKEMVNGQVLVKKLKYDEASKTFKGTMSPPDANLELNATVTIVSNDKLKIVAKKLVMSKTIHLIRIK